MIHYYQTDIECPKCNSTVRLDVSEEGVDVIGASVPGRIDQLEKALEDIKWVVANCDDGYCVPSDGIGMIRGYIEALKESK